MTFIQPQRLEVLPQPFFIVTEGMGDARFIDELLHFKGIANCSVGCPSRENSKNKMGKDALPDYLLAIQTARVRAKSVPMRGLSIVADADGDASKSCTAVVTALKNAQFPQPPDAFTISDVNGFKVAIYLIPGKGETGTLEHLLLRAVFKESPVLEKCLEEFASCTGGLKSAKPNAQAKMRMSALAATFCADNPWCSPSNMWSDKGNPVPLNSDCFNHLHEFLAAFSA
jgi:hypothetical protein